jgi:RNA polymerase sigma factor (TIGR02999 family)
MPAADPKTVTTMLTAARSGSAEAVRQLFPLIYEELRSLAASHMARRVGGDPHGTMQPTALVHEAYLRLLGDLDVPWADRRQFFAAAAVAVRDILVERARRKARPKHGGGRARVDLDAADQPHDALGPDDAQLLALDEALSRLNAANPRRAEIVMLRYFGGLSIEDTANALELSPATVKREWALAKAELYEQLRP